MLSFESVMTRGSSLCPRHYRGEPAPRRSTKMLPGGGRSFWLGRKSCQVPFIDSIMLLVVPCRQAISYIFFMPQPRKNQPSSIDLTDSDLIGSQIKRSRLKRGLSQAELAAQVGLSREAIAAYESGRVRLLDDMIARIAIALSVSADVLLGLKPIPNDEEKSALRLTRRLRELDRLPEQKRKAILKTLDDLIRANS